MTKYLINTNSSIRVQKPYDPGKLIELAVRGGIWWDFTQNATITDAAMTTLGNWVPTRANVTGSGPWIFSETGGTGTHFAIASASSNIAAGPCTTAIVAKKSGTGRDYIWVGGASGTQAAMFSLIDGSCTAQQSAVLGYSSINLGSGEWLFVTNWTWSSGGLAAYGASTGPTFASWTYSDDGRECFTIRAPTSTERLTYGLTDVFTQRRASQLAPRVGSGTLIQATSAAQPLIWNGSNWVQTSGLKFNGAQYMVLSAADRAQPGTIITVQSPAVAAASYVWLDSVDGFNRWISYTDASGSYIINGGLAVSTGFTQTLGTQIRTTHFNGSSSFDRKNGIQGSNVNAGTNSCKSGFYIGATSGPSLYANGMLKDVMYIPGAFNSTNIQRIERWLGELRGVTVA